MAGTGVASFDLTQGYKTEGLTTRMIPVPEQRRDGSSKFLAQSDRGAHETRVFHLRDKRVPVRNETWPLIVPKVIITGT